MRSANPLLVGMAIGIGVCVVGGPAGASNFGTIAKVPSNALHKQLPPSSGQPPPLHLQCIGYPASQIPTPIISTNLPGAIVITNKTSHTIAANTLYTYSLSGQGSTYQDDNPLAPTGNIVLPLLVAISGVTSCDATVPAAAASGG